MNKISSTTKDARQVRTRKRLLQALLSILEKRPFEQVTIREIVGEAEIGYATFFRHYPSKEELLQDLAANQISSLLDRTLPILFSTDSRASCEALFEYISQNRPLWKALLTGGAAAVLKQELVTQAKLIAEGHKTVGGRIPNEIRVIFSVGATVEIMAWWLQQGPEVGIAHIAEILDRLVIVPAINND